MAIDNLYSREKTGSNAVSNLSFATSMVVWHSDSTSSAVWRCVLKIHARHVLGISLSRHTPATNSTVCCCSGTLHTHAMVG